MEIRKIKNRKKVNKMNNIFLIVSYGRTGSTVLRRYLDSRDDCSCYGEIFHKNSILYKENAPNDPVGHIKQICLQKSPCGCKIISTYHDDTKLKDICSAGFKTIYLYRENDFKCAMSDYLANLVGNWDDYTKLIKNPIVINEEKLDRIIARKKKEKERIKLLHEKYPGLHIEYNALKKPNCLKSILMFIGAKDDKNLVLPGKEIDKNKIKNKISNLDCLCLKYKNSYID